MSQFFAMGGYAQFVWPAYALVIGVMVLNVVWARRSLRKARDEARRRLIAKGEMK
jgi:heme exporter protein CcmD